MSDIPISCNSIINFIKVFDTWINQCNFRINQCNFRINGFKLFYINNKSVRMVPPNVSREHGSYFLFEAVKLPAGLERLGI